MTNTNRGQLAFDLVTQAIENTEAQRQARITGAKTNFDKLFAAGVIVTCDDEMEASFYWTYCQKIAKQAGVVPGLVDAASVFARIYGSAVDQLKDIVRHNETGEEFTVRLMTAAAKVEGFEPGAKRSCKHKSTKTKQGLMRIGNGMSENIEFVCCRCGKSVYVSAKAEQPTEAAIQAAATLAALR